MAKLVTTLLVEPFVQWGLDFISLIKPIGRSTKKRYILVIINYVVKWVEAKAFRINTIMVTTKFIYEFILIKFGCPFTLVNDQGVHFINATIEILIA
jgi:hypothetical protein